MKPIVIACAVLALSLSNAQAAPTGVSIESLTAQQRLTLPDATMVSLPNGRVVSLHILRAEHLARLARFGRGAPLGVLGSIVVTQKLVPMSPVTSGPVDYKLFCNAVKVSGCLYYPANAHFTYGEDSWDDYDPMVTDAGVCASEGGVPENGCKYKYPRKQMSSFNPGMPPLGQPIGYGVTSTQNCTDGFYVALDPKGSLTMVAPAKLIQGPQSDPDDAWAGFSETLNTGATPASCRVRIYVPK